MYDFFKEDEFGDPEEPVNSDRSHSKSERSQIHNAPKTIDEIRLRRFLCLGTESGAYHTDEMELTCKENVSCIDRLINKGEGLQVVETIREFSIENKACKATPVIFALSICCRCNDHKTKDAAYKILSDVCRIPTHLFEFIKYCRDVNPNGDGWGRAHRKGVSMWYQNYSNKKGGIPLLAFHMTKYKSRFGFTHRDVFRLCHIKTDYDALGYPIYHFCRYQNQTDTNWSKHLELAKQQEGFEQSELKKVIDLLQVFDDAKNCDDEEMMKRMILEHHPFLVREHVPTELLNSKEVWGALMRFMPMTAMIRNLDKMSNLGLLESDGFGETLTVDKLMSKELLKTAMVHPITLLVAEKAYSKGQSESKKQRLNWEVNPKVRKALKEAFYVTVNHVETTGKRYLLAICMNGSVNAHETRTPIITARDVAAAMAMVTGRREQRCRCLFWKPIDRICQR